MVVILFVYSLVEGIYIEDIYDVKSSFKSEILNYVISFVKFESESKIYLLENWLNSKQAMLMRKILNFSFKDILQSAIKNLNHPQLHEKIDIQGDSNLSVPVWEVMSREANIFKAYT